MKARKSENFKDEIYSPEEAAQVQRTKKGLAVVTGTVKRSAQSKDRFDASNSNLIRALRDRIIHTTEQQQ